MKTLNLLALIGLTAGIGLLAAPSAQAGTVAPLPNCPRLGFTLDTYLPGGPTVGCSVGDKNFSNFVYSATVPASNVSVTIGGTDMSHTLNFTALSPTPFWSLGNGQQLKYDVTVNTRSSEFIKMLAGGMTTSLPGTSAIGSIDVSSTHTGTCLGTVSFDCTASPIDISPLVENTTVSNEFNVTTNGSTGITQISNTVLQTPGPLPIVGVGAAFGISRKMRRRISIAV